MECEKPICEHIEQQMGAVATHWSRKTKDMGPTKHWEKETGERRPETKRNWKPNYNYHGLVRQLFGPTFIRSVNHMVRIHLVRKLFGPNIIWFEHHLVRTSCGPKFIRAESHCVRILRSENHLGQNCLALRARSGCSFSPALVGRDNILFCFLLHPVTLLPVPFLPFSFSPVVMFFNLFFSGALFFWRPSRMYQNRCVVQYFRTCYCENIDNIIGFGASYVRKHCNTNGFGTFYEKA